MNATLDIPTPAQLAKNCTVINDVEEWLAAQPTAIFETPPVVCRFTPGLMSRQITMPAGLVCTSKIHRTEHQYIVSRGRLRVWCEETGWVEIVAPYHGVTKPGARRVLAVAVETVWTTFHPGNWKTVEEAEADLIEPRDIPRKEVT